MQIDVSMSMTEIELDEGLRRYRPLEMSLYCLERPELGYPLWDIES